MLVLFCGTILLKRVFNNLIFGILRIWTVVSSVVVTRRAEGHVADGLPDMSLTHAAVEGMFSVVPGHKEWEWRRESEGMKWQRGGCEFTSSLNYVTESFSWGSLATKLYRSLSKLLFERGSWPLWSVTFTCFLGRSSLHF
ncbi:hypothetical protein J6590_041643 [Homalodisca vitripennis]|nr:hypothetical protein J6590_041643 [Homalodisca vitripennis]